MTVIAVNFFATSSTRQLKSTEAEQSGGKLDKAEDTGYRRSVHIQITGKTESPSTAF